MPSSVSLRDVTTSDLAIFFDHQQEQSARHMAAFTSEDPLDRSAFDAFWERIGANEAITIRTVLVSNEVAGNVMSFVQDGKLDVTYWLGQSYWGKGIATAALSQLLHVVTERPIYARAAKDNIASIRVLEKCGFAIIADDKGFANARGEEIEEYVLELKG